MRTNHFDAVLQVIKPQSPHTSIMRLPATTLAVLGPLIGALLATASHPHPRLRHLQQAQGNQNQANTTSPAGGAAGNAATGTGQGQQSNQTTGTAGGAGADWNQKVYPVGIVVGQYFMAEKMTSRDAIRNLSDDGRGAGRRPHARAAEF
jgi:hypothetical protein